MADKNVRPLAKTGNLQIVNALKGMLSPQYQMRIPAATQGNMREFADTLEDFPAMRDEFFNAFVQKIVSTWVQHTEWADPLRTLGAPNTLKRYGSVYEQAMVGLIEARDRDFNQAYGAADIFGDYRAPVKTIYHPLTFDHYYPVTVPRDALLTAFRSEDGLSSLIAEIMDAPVKSDNNDTYLLATQCFAEYARAGGFYRVNVPDVSADTSTEADAKKLLRRMRAMADRLRSTPLSGMSRYNAAHWVTPWDESKAIVFATPEAIAAMDVEALASMLNFEKAEAPYRIIPIPADMFGINGVQAIMTTEDFFFRWDELIETTNSPVNPITGEYNVFYKHRGSITPNPMANAILFWTGEGTPETFTPPTSATAGTPTFQLMLSACGYDQATPQNVTRGARVQVVSTITAQPSGADFTPKGIMYELEGAKSQYTHIDNNGIITCGLDEDASTLIVKAQATYINPATPEIDQQVSAALSVPVVGDYVGGWNANMYTGLRIEVYDTNGKPVTKVDHLTTSPYRVYADTVSGSTVEVTDSATVTSPDGTVDMTAHTITAPGAGSMDVTATGYGLTTTKTYPIYEKN